MTSRRGSRRSAGDHHFHNHRHTQPLHWFTSPQGGHKLPWPLVCNSWSFPIPCYQLSPQHDHQSNVRYRSFVHPSSQASNDHSMVIKNGMSPRDWRRGLSHRSNQQLIWQWCETWMTRCVRSVDDALVVLRCLYHLCQFHSRWLKLVDKLHTHLAQLPWTPSDMQLVCSLWLM